MKNKINAVFVVSAVLSVVLVNGCSEIKAQEGGADDIAAESTDGAAAESLLTDELLAAMNWTLVSVQDGENEAAQTLSSGIAANRYKLSFVDQLVSLSGGCNRASCSYAIDTESDDNISFHGAWTSTAMACEKALMEADSELKELLSGVTRYQLEGEQLILSGAGKTLLFTGTANANDEAKLAAMNWTLVSVQDGENEASKTLSSGIPANRYKLSFNEQSVQLTGGVNNASSNFAIDAESDDDNISFGQWRSTLRAGDPALMEADSELQKILSGVTHYQLEGEQLILSGADKILLFSGTATDEANFGGEGKRRFIDIRNTANGLVWREVEYDSNWIQTNKDAPWLTENFLGIRDFTPELNREYTVRINEFQDDSGNPVWVKDMIVMQGTYEDN